MRNPLTERRSTRTRSRGRSDAAFTLMEILVGLALLGLLAGLFVANVGTLVGNRKVDVEEIFWKAVVEARKYALLQGTDVRLLFDAKEKAFKASTSAGSRTFPVPVEGELEIDFLGVSKGGRTTVLIGGTLVETQPLAYVTFYSDGTCSDFRAQLRQNQGEPRYVRIDPWTCAPMLAQVGSNP
ncbi:MAG TPA: prepilin-type N-terminal cleavage/methylation domain-containing protein [Opitutaceae bacterium]|nr:prepilin-type N-terminal cleavage/methylation domain-containing protein [Opitutaceae bacterium]